MGELNTFLGPEPMLERPFRTPYKRKHANSSRPEYLKFLGHDTASVGELL